MPSWISAKSVAVSTKCRRRIGRPVLGVLLAVATGAPSSSVAADYYWRTDGTLGTYFAGTNWNVGSATSTGGSAWVDNSTTPNNAVFNANSQVSWDGSGTSYVGGITVADN